MIAFTVPAIPVAQPRQRHRVVSAKGRTFTMNFTPRKDPVNDYKATVRMAAEKVYTGPPLDGPLDVTLGFVLPRPQSMRWKTRAMPRVWDTRGKDLDNLAKSTLDALAGLLFVNDCQVCRLVLTKEVASGYEAPCVVVSVKRMAEV